MPDFSTLTWSRFVGGGQTYDIWVNDTIAPNPIAVFVFRGTNKSSWSDWQANLHHITNTPGKWDQYEQAVTLTDSLTKKLVATYGPNLRVFAAGHSLGGGLAQCVRHYIPRIEKVFAFNSSPVTDARNAPLLDQTPRAQRRPTYMIYESNEILAGLRLVPNFLYQFKNGENVVSVRYNFSERHHSLLPVGQHSMQALVDGLTKPE